MPIQIGQPAGHGFAEPFGLLSDCHRRIERFLAMLRRIATENRGGALDGDHRHALDVALKYFREAAPKHTADEEQSVFPRFLAAGGDPAELGSLAGDHRRADALHARADALGREWLDQGSLAEAGELIAVLDELDAIYAAHIRYEDTHLFPLAARVIPPAAQREIGAEMAARRGR